MSFGQIKCFVELDKNFSYIPSEEHVSFMIRVFAAGGILECVLQFSPSFSLRSKDILCW